MGFLTLRWNGSFWAACSFKKTKSHPSAANEQLLLRDDFMLKPTYFFLLLLPFLSDFRVVVFWTLCPCCLDNPVPPLQVIGHSIHTLHHNNVRDEQVMLTYLVKEVIPIQLSD